MKKVSLLLMVALVFFTACSDETTVFETQDNNLSLETNEQVLLNSIVYDNAGVIDLIAPTDASIAKSFGFTSNSNNNDDATNFPLTLVAQVAPPSFANGGENLTASHVDIDGNFAYVSYNTVGAVYAGGLDIINVSDPNNPRVTSRLYFTNADISALKYDGGFVYAVGGFNAELSTFAETNSFVAKISAVNGRFSTSGVLFGFQDGFVATDVDTTADTILVTSGQDGYLAVYNKSTVEIEQEIAFPDLRSVDIRDNRLALLDGSFGVRILDQNSLETNSEIPIDTDFGIAKRTVAFSGDKVIVSEGPTGAGVYNFSTGSFLERIPIALNPEGVANEDIVTNAVASNEEIILMANGGAGLCLSEAQANGLSTDIVGIIGLEGSINYVESKGDYVYAASGTQGLQIIKLNRPDASLAARCANLPAYTGSFNLNVNQGEELAFSGSRGFNNVNVNGSLLLCGSWTARNATIINSNALFEMNGNYTVGRNNRRRDIVLNQGATFRVEGNLTIFGDLILNDGATLEFIGEDSVVNIFGDVTIADSATVNGTFEDLQNKF